MSDAGYSIGWWIESADEEIYGPVSRETLQRFLTAGVISRNTLVRHCTQEVSRPVVDQPGVASGLTQLEAAPAIGDRLADAWPGSRRERLALADGGLPCAVHNRPALAVCLRCHAPYCRKCQMKPYKRSFYFCKRCQGNHNNRRFFAFVFDTVLAYMLLIGFLIPVFLLTAILGAADQSPGGAFVFGQVAWMLAIVVFVLRDSLMAGAGPGKRATDLRVVRDTDGTTPLGHGQAVVRFLPMMIPLIPLVEAYLIYRDPLMRRLGDRWAKTRVIDTAPRLEATRAETRARLAKKGIEPVVPEKPEATLEQFAQIGA